MRQRGLYKEVPEFGVNKSEGFAIFWPKAFSVEKQNKNNKKSCCFFKKKQVHYSNSNVKIKENRKKHELMDWNVKTK